jgi:hypothetical protein
MKKRLSYLGIFIGLAALGSQSCQKSNNTIDNGSVVGTAYTLYFGDTSGALFNTNDGVNINVLPFTADGVPFRAICTSKSILLFAKSTVNLYFSSNNGANFNISYDTLRMLPGVGVDGYTFDLNQSSIIDIPRWNRVYIVSSSTSPTNCLGVAYSFSNGIWGSWTLESYYNPDSVAAMPTTLTSMTFTTGNVLMGWDAVNHRSFYRADTFATTEFNETTPGVGWNPTGIALPNTGFFSIGHLNNEIIAIDNSGTNGAYFSDDLGRDWTAFSGLPTNTPLTCTYSPFEEVNLIGTVGQGVYIINNAHAYQPANNGLPANVTVRAITAKENVYKNGSVQKVVFLATNKGLYKSLDMAQNWVLVQKGNFTAMY